MDLQRKIEEEKYDEYDSLFITVTSAHVYSRICKWDKDFFATSTVAAC